MILRTWLWCMAGLHKVLQEKQLKRHSILFFLRASICPRDSNLIVGTSQKLRKIHIQTNDLVGGKQTSFEIKSSHNPDWFYQWFWARCVFVKENNFDTLDKAEDVYLSLPSVCKKWPFQKYFFPYVCTYQIAQRKLNASFSFIAKFRVFFFLWQELTLRSEQ